MISTLPSSSGLPSLSPEPVRQFHPSEWRRDLNFHRTALDYNQPTQRRRSNGYHISSIIRYLSLKSNLLNDYGSSSDEYQYLLPRRSVFDNWLIDGGFSWEEWAVQHVASFYPQKYSPFTIHQPCEIELEMLGRPVFMSPDGLTFLNDFSIPAQVIVLEEFKYTTRSSANSYPPYWSWQKKAYLYGLLFGKIHNPMIYIDRELLIQSDAFYARSTVKHRRGDYSKDSYALDKSEIATTCLDKYTMDDLSKTMTMLTNAFSSALNDGAIQPEVHDEEPAQ